MDLSGVEDEEMLAGCGRVVGVGLIHSCPSFAVTAVGLCVRYCILHSRIASIVIQRLKIENRECDAQ